MGTSGLRTALMALAALTTSSHLALAQVQQGYSSEYGAPDVQVDRSVLEDLKGYQPPPMFAAPPTADDVTVIDDNPRDKKTPAAIPVAPKIAPAPAAPSLTAPKAEDVLNHPVENLHVLTEHNSSMTQPEADSVGTSDLPVPTGQAPSANKAMTSPQPEKIAHTTPTQKSKSPLPKHKPTNLDTSKEKPTPEVKPVLKADIKKENTKVTAPVKEAKPQKHAEQPAEQELDIITVPDNKTLADPPKVAPPVAYRPKAEKLMPAVPPVSVEKKELAPLPNNALPALPPTTQSEPQAKTKKPSIGERLMDAALMRNIESDEDTIKEKLKETTDKNTGSKIEAKAEKESAPTHKGLIFRAGESTLSPQNEKTLNETIVPKALKETSTRLQILSFASSTDGSESSARRVSLSRALSVRDYLLSQHIDSSRIDVRALANQGGETPADRVDIVFTGE